MRLVPDTTAQLALKEGAGAMGVQVFSPHERGEESSEGAKRVGPSST